MAKVSTNIGLDADLKKSAQELFADFGLDLTTAITMFLKQAVREQRIPFEIKRDIPNQQTIAALAEYEEMKQHPEKYKRYSTFQEALDEVLTDA
ncbi:MAG: type II toxin-antitoxin system RelB/DinJ family antitoxin [Peptococcaceae bacterium]|mgnify:CR=1 FL=1|jgi:DNA-damage-inducible protein J|nr:type II toxin-antitoxin system RelB/DinJ family antitoxin [Peptococcaceae bacterium]MBQ5683617.1 type II toxin-antitoxin system RelB/DinJ family antitoxin [Peptococcaceae bacterium]